MRRDIQEEAVSHQRNSFPSANNLFYRPEPPSALGAGVLVVRTHSAPLGEKARGTRNRGRQWSQAMLPQTLLRLQELIQLLTIPKMTETLYFSLTSEIILMK